VKKNDGREKRGSTSGGYQLRVRKVAILKFRVTRKKEKNELRVNWGYGRFNQQFNLQGNFPRKKQGKKAITNHSKRGQGPRNTNLTALGYRG